MKNKGRDALSIARDFSADLTPLIKKHYGETIDMDTAEKMLVATSILSAPLFAVMTPAERFLAIIEWIDRTTALSEDFTKFANRTKQ